MSERDMIEDLLESARRSGKSEDLRATLTRASLDLDRIIDRILSVGREDG